MKEITGKCKSCLGCNRLEIEEFKGIEECSNYAKRKEYCRRLYKNNT